MPKAIGIDLGTTNSIVAHLNVTSGAVEVVLNRSYERSTRSVVGLHKKTGAILVGSQAVDHAARNPENTIFSVRRLIGRSYDDPNVREVQRRYAYRIVKAPDGDDVRVMLGEQMLTPTEVSAIILRGLKEDAELRLNEEVTHAVITVPAYFSVNQRLATRTAGELAGLRVMHILDEPVAAAVAYGVGRYAEPPASNLVYYFCGDAFDVSILFVIQDSFNLLATEGDMWLGGDDFDYAIMDYVLREVRKEHGIDLSPDQRLMYMLRKEAERAKIRLGEMLSTAVVLDSAVPVADGTREDIEVELTRSDFENLPISEQPIRVSGVEEALLRRWCSDLELEGCEFSDRQVRLGPDTVQNRIKKTILLCRKAMLEAEVTKDDIDHVLLVGRSTYIPLVQRMLEEEFGHEKIMRDVDPVQCVAEGAAIVATR
jgi:molecular chaperone DnaK